MTKTRELRPVRERPEYYEALEQYLAKHFRDEIYLPLMREIGAPKSDLTNSKEDLYRAIASGQIRYVDGGFEGKFSAAISRELKALGAVWRKGAWKLPSARVSADMRTAMAASEERFRKMAEKVNRRLDAISPKEVADKMKLDKLFDSVVYKVNADFNETVKSLGVQPKLTDEQRRIIARDYTNNMRLYIREWTEKEIVRLRKDVEENAVAGARYEDMIETIQRGYGVSKNKAKFLARQETSLLMTKFKETRYKDAGINSYKWKCVAGSPAHPVRPMHKALDGKTFTWDTPPIVDAKGERKHPGQDYNCRCTAIPIVRF